MTDKKIIKQEYFKRKTSGEKKIIEKMIIKFNLKSSRLYQIINEREVSCYQEYRMIAKKKHELLWNRKFKKIFEKIPKGRTKIIMKRKVELIEKMVSSGYTFLEIAELLGYGSDKSSVHKLWKKSFNKKNYKDTNEGIPLEDDFYIEEKSI